MSGRLTNSRTTACYREAVRVENLDEDVIALIESAQVETAEPYDLADIPDEPASSRPVKKMPHGFEDGAVAHVDLRPIRRKRLARPSA